ncbi:PLP-dependent aminotransferase family protein [Streptococcus didelphis]|uniref:PLP-dependent aminotransferase family protein n=1 Tax=Streptococcus didelphis TaxID=102886 RepID=A0ABY9LHE4_9STRE|nr:PLP-dependent aminotransferase family protein [Streptococcus didelphis]WMB28263.1 PLP-dependent aminotransferase family protein [Streptococcus didelphis]WMB28937.1 PLP-dependent aminotransferase family protein [Streptococcus didelphis]
MVSKYKEISDDIQRQIKEGKLKKGDRIPSIRQLSSSYACSKDTVQRALLDLKYKQKLYAVPQSGYYVLDNYQLTELAPYFSLKEYNNLAYNDFRLCLNEALTGKETYLFNYYHQEEGLKELLFSLKNYLSGSAIYTNLNHIVVTSGSQQALYILCQMPFLSNKEVILLERPTYQRMESLVRALNLPLQFIERTSDSIDLKALEDLFKTGNIKYFYTISRYSNPLGLSYSRKEKEAIVELAHRYQVYIIEDDYLGDFAKTSEPALHYYDTNERVIYLKSFSMSIFPALRLASLVLPTSLLKTFLAYKSLIDLDTNLLMQKALSLYLDNGMFDKNLKYIKTFLQKKTKSLLSYLDKYYPELDYHVTAQHIIISCFPSIQQLKLAKEKSLDIIKTKEAYYIRFLINDATASQIDNIFKE